MAEYLVQSESLTAVADAIREKVGSGGLVFPAGFVEAIQSIKAGGGGYGEVSHFNAGMVTIPQSTKPMEFVTDTALTKLNWYIIYIFYVSSPSVDHVSDIMLVNNLHKGVSIQAAKYMLSSTYRYGAVDPSQEILVEVNPKGGMVVVNPTPLSVPLRSGDYNVLIMGG